MFALSRLSRSAAVGGLVILGGYGLPTHADELAQNGLGLPLRGLLNKPFTLPELVAFVERAFSAEEESVDA